jgi:hypothetical protein
MSASNKTFYTFFHITESMGYSFEGIPCLFSRRKMNDLLNTLCNPAFVDATNREWAFKRLGIRKDLYNIDEIYITKVKKLQYKKQIKQHDYTVFCRGCRAKKGEKLIEMQYPLKQVDLVNPRTGIIEAHMVYNQQLPKIEVDTTEYYKNWKYCQCIHRNAYYDHTSFIQMHFSYLFTYNDALSFRTGHLGYIHYV